MPVPNRAYRIKLITGEYIQTRSYVFHEEGFLKFQTENYDETKTTIIPITSVLTFEEITRKDKDDEQDPA